MQPTDQPPDVFAVPAPVHVPHPVDVALRRLTLTANHGVLWFGIGAVGVLIGGRSKRAALRGLASLSMASFVSNSIVKPLVGRRRPDPERTHVARRIGQRPWTSSFPSGHSASAAAFATAAALEMPASALVLGPLAAAVGYSRVHVGVHYKSDVVVGMAIGATLAVVGRRLWPVKPHGAAVMDSGTAPALPGGDGLVIVLNRAAGSSDQAKTALSHVLPQARVVEWDPDAIELADLVDKDARAIGTAGGDGTAASVAELAYERGVPLAVFPFGTLNHFAGALGLQTELDTAAAIERGSAGEVRLATVNGRGFLNTASIGGYPELVIRRDRLSKRMGKWPAAGYALYRTLRHQRPMDLVIEGELVPCWVLFVGNGVYRPRGLAPAWRNALSEGVLDVQFLRADRPLARTKGVLLSFLGLVERSEVFTAAQFRQVTIMSKSGPLVAAHDGEVAAPAEEIVFAIADRPLTVYR